MEMANSCVACVVHSDNPFEVNNRKFGKLFFFPEDPELRKKWAQFCKYTDSNDVNDHHAICAGHFLSSDFVHPITNEENMTLNSEAVPTLQEPVSYLINSRKAPKNKKRNYCVICGLVNENTRVYKFPSNPERAQKWAALCNLPISEVKVSKRLCQVHFNVSDYVYARGKLRNRLVKDAVPSLVLPQVSENRNFSSPIEMPSSTSSINERRTMNVVNKVNLNSNRQQIFSMAVDKSQISRLVNLNSNHPQIFSVAVDKSQISRSVNLNSNSPQIFSVGVDRSQINRAVNLNSNRPQIFAVGVDKSQINRSVNLNSNPKQIFSIGVNNSQISRSDGSHVVEENITVISDSDDENVPINANHTPEPCQSTSSSKSRGQKVKNPPTIRYFGDAKPEDLGSLDRARQVVNVATKSIDRYKVTIRKLRRQNCYLKKKLNLAIDTIEEFARRAAEAQDA